MLPDPVRVDKAVEEDTTAAAVGVDVAGVLRYHLSVLDRENRLESGTGDWRTLFLSDALQRERAVEESVLRTVQMAVAGPYFAILERLAAQGHMRTSDLADACEISELTLHERVSDLVSAGLASKIPEADQVSLAPSGMAIVEWIRRSVAAALSDLKELE